MKNNQYAGLKKESAENEDECWQMLARAREVHKDAVVFDATQRNDGGIHYSSYTYEGETLLQKRAQIFINQPNIDDLVVGSGGGTLVAVLTDEEKMPPWVQTHGIPVPVGMHTGSEDEETDD